MPTICSRHVALSFIAFSGIVSYAIIRKKASSLKSKAKCRYTQAEKIEDGKDMISNLSNDLLISIIERLSTIEAVRTSVLSKRWSNLYTFVPQVEFDCLHMFGLEPSDHTKVFSYFGYKKNSTSVLQEKFIKGVDTFLDRFSDSRLVSCKLACCFISSFPNELEQWICSLARLGIEQLSLKFDCRNISTTRFICEASSPSFSCQFLDEVPSLQFLALTGCFLRPNFGKQCNNNNNLKILHLTAVNIHPNAMDCILSNCLNLEVLQIAYCTVLGSKLCICGPNLQLKDLFIDACYDVEEIELYASNLTTFECFNRRMIKFSFHHVPLLEKSCISFLDDNDEHVLYHDLATPLPRLKSLIFQASEEYFQTCAYLFMGVRRKTGTNMFSNLTRIHLGFPVFPPDTITIFPLLQLCPLLEEFHLSTKNTEVPSWITILNGGRIEREIDSLHRHLKKVELSGFSGTEREVKIIACIVASALVLEKMCFSSYYSYYNGKGEWLNTPTIPWNEERRKIIRQMVQRQSISGTVHVLFR